jgi:hypothetical protein
MSNQMLKYISKLLEDLPDTLPDCGDNSEYYEALHPFIMDENHIVRIGDEALAFCYVLDTIFKSDNQWMIMERGWGISKVITVLEHYLEKFPENKDILQWMDGFKMALMTVYHEANCRVSQSLAVPCYIL